MAISYVGGVTGAALNGANVTLDLTALTGGSNSSPSTDDIVIVAYGIGDNDNIDFDMAMVTAGYTEVADLFSDDDADMNLGVFWKVMGGTPDTSAQVDGQGGTDAGVVAAAMVFRGVDTTTPMDVTPTTATGINSHHPDPPSIDPVTAGVATVIAGCGGSTTATVTAPTNYTTDALTVSQTETTSISMGMAHRLDPGDPEDPGTFSVGGTDTSTKSWCAATLALRPASVPTTFERSAALDGAGSIASSGIFFALFTAAVALDGAALIASAGHIFLHARAASLGATGAIASVGAQSYIYETFDKANSAVLGPIMTWTEVTGNADVVSNEVNSNSSIQRSRAEAYLISDDMWAQAECAVTSETGAAASGVGVRYNDEVNASFDGYTFMLDFPADLVRLYRVANGTGTQIASASVTLNVSTYYTARLEAVGSVLTGFVDGVEVLSFDDTSPGDFTPGRKAGFQLQKTIAPTAKLDAFEAGTEFAAVVERSASVDATAAVTSSGVIIHVFTRDVAVAASAAIVSTFVPFKVSGLITTPISSSQIDLEWDELIYQGGGYAYDIERDGVVILRDHPLTTYSDTGLTSSTEYDYRVRAVRGPAPVDAVGFTSVVGSAVVTEVDEVGRAVFTDVDELGTSVP